MGCKPGNPSGEDFCRGPYARACDHPSNPWEEELGGENSSVVLNSPPRSPAYNVPVVFNLREFRQGDFEILWKIDQKCFPPGISYSRPELRHYIERPGAFTLIAEGENSTPIGGFIVGESGKRAMGHIITIDVLPEIQRAGTGSLLLRAAEDRLLSRGCRFVYLETAVDNTPALSFYKRHGYFVIKTQPRYYSNGTDALVLKKELAA